MARHYLDHASTTAVRVQARAAMAAWDDAGITADPGRVHTEGRMVRATLEEARDQIAALFGVRSRQVVLTSGGTEAINAGVWGATRADPGPVACSSVEHSAVRDASGRSGPVVAIAVDRQGRIEVEAVQAAIDQCQALHGRLPALVHCQWANHEVGTVQPVAEVVEHCSRLGLAVHVDAVAAAGHVALDIEGLGADLVSVSAHKLGGPAGAGALIVRRGLRLEALLVGGGLRLTGTTPDATYVEIVEIPGHPFFLGCQFHPEFKSKPLEPHPLFRDFVAASYANRNGDKGTLITVGETPHEAVPAAKA